MIPLLFSPFLIIDTRNTPINVPIRPPAINAAIEVISDCLAEGDKVQLVGFGAFEVKSRAERIGRNPKTKESIKIPASKVPVFKPGKALKDIVAK